MEHLQHHKLTGSLPSSEVERHAPAVRRRGARSRSTRVGCIGDGGKVIQKETQADISERRATAQGAWFIRRDNHYTDCSTDFLLSLHPPLMQKKRQSRL